MSTITLTPLGARPAPRLLSLGLHLCAAAVALGLVGGAWAIAGEASQEAVSLAGAGQAVQRVTLPTVTVVFHRDAAVASVACATGATL